MPHTVVMNLDNISFFSQKCSHSSLEKTSLIFELIMLAKSFVTISSSGIKVMECILDRKVSIIFFVGLRFSI